MQASEMEDQMPLKRRKLTCDGDEYSVAVLYQFATVKGLPC